MDIEEAQDLIRRIYLERDKERGMERTLLRTFQELAELSDAIAKEKLTEEIEAEVADVFAWVISIANLLEMDLGKTLLRKYNNACSRCGKVPCECIDTR
ncbi:MAG: MazG nucleotide pyrophosphohydrolase domain-containing protein [Candidatus Thorarchaeota archaeon]|nr:MazG nucleotide pyrophosphohydrolase domain-containing protein [Candidatus Thorarchaeota archaeon]